MASCGKLPPRVASCRYVLPRHQRGKEPQVPYPSYLGELINYYRINQQRLFNCDSSLFKQVSLVIPIVIKLRLIVKGLIPTPFASLIISPSLKPSLSPLFSVTLIRYSATTLQLYLALGPPYLGQQRLKSPITIVLQFSPFIYLRALFSFRSIYPLRRPSSRLYGRRGFGLQMLNIVIIYCCAFPQFIIATTIRLPP